MKILLATMGMDIGGAETHILELAKELHKRGHEIIVVSNGGKYVSELEENNITHIWAPLNNKNPINMIKSYNILKRTILENSIKLVHSHTRISSFICGKLHNRLKFPYVTTAHWTFKVTPLLKTMSNWGEETIAVSEDIKKYLMDNYKIPEDRIIVTVNGIDTTKFSKNTDFSDIIQEFDLKNPKNKIVYISRLDESRALVAKQLVNISEELNSKIDDLEIVIVGGGDAFSEINAKAQAINEKLGKKLIVMTNSRTDINKFASYGRIFIGVSRSALEAMSSEKPTIVAGNEGYLGVFDESKLDKAIETNFCCRGLEMSSEEMLKKDIISLINQSDEELDREGAYNKSVVEKYYSINKMVDDCLNAYDKCLKKYDFGDTK